MDTREDAVFSFSIPAGVKEPARTGTSGAFDLFMPCEHLLQPREVTSISTRVTYRLPLDTVGFVVPHPNGKGIVQILDGGFVGEKRNASIRYSRNYSLSPPLQTTTL